MKSSISCKTYIITHCQQKERSFVDRRTNQATVRVDVMLMLSLQSLLIDRHRLHADSTSYARRRVTVVIRLLRRSSSLLLTSTETVRITGDGELRTATSSSSMLLYVLRDHTDYYVHLDSHTAPEL